MSGLLDTPGRVVRGRGCCWGFSGVSVHGSRVHEIGVRGKLVARRVILEDYIALNAPFAHSEHSPSGIREREVVELTLIDLTAPVDTPLPSISNAISSVDPTLRP